MRTRRHPVILVLAACFIFAAPTAGRADNLFRFYPEFEGGALYSDNIPLRTNNQMGDWVGTMVGGFYLDYTSAARYTSLHYDTFAQLFAHQSRYDRAGEGQFVNLNDDENISRTTKLRISELFYRSAPTLAGIVTSDQAPQFNNVAAQLILANEQASINRFAADLSHYWGHNWSSGLNIRQSTFWSDNTSNNRQTGTSFDQNVSTFTEYHFGDRFSLGGGYRFYDFMFTHPGRPGLQAHWPFAKIAWEPIENFYLSGVAGAVISYTQGTDEQAVNPAGLGLLEYRYKRARLRIYGGQEPELTSVIGTAGNVRLVRGQLQYDFTQRLTGEAGGGFYEAASTGFNWQLITWGVGLNQRVNKWLRVYARYVQLRRTETTTNSEFLPGSTQNGKEAVGNYFILGLNVSVEAFRWSWQ